MSTRVIRVRPQNPDIDLLAEAAAALRTGKVIVFPTETVYGIGALHRFPDAVERIYCIKGRDKAKPMAYHIANYVFVNAKTFQHNRAFHYLAKKFWPGPLTIVVRGEGVETYGFRMPSHPVARVLIELVGDPMLATSANASGDESPVTGDQALAGMDGKVDLLINSGKCDDGVDSTVVDLTAQPFKILRSGSKGAEIQKALDELNNGVPPKFRVLYVCTGNTCRSPMAEWWLKTRLAKDGFEDKVEVESCGIFAYKNMPATTESGQVLKEDGIDLSKHLARPITHDMAREADFIYAMTAEHQQFILRQFPYLSGKITVLDVQDPIGMDLSVYRACYADIKKKMAEEVKTLEEKCK